MLAPMPRAVRRRAAGLLGVPLLLALTGCAGLGQPVPYDSPGINGLVIPTPSPDAGDFVAVVDNPWLALEPGTSRRYDVVGDAGVEGTVETEVLAGTTEVAGLTATGVRTVTEVDGVTTDETRFYAQDDAGNVWLVGVASTTGLSWRAGASGAEAGLAMPADLRLGDGWLTYRVPNLLEPTTMVEDVSREMAELRETAGGEADTMSRVYESGAGLVSIEDVDAGWQAVLVE